MHKAFHSVSRNGRTRCLYYYRPGFEVQNAMAQDRFYVPAPVDSRFSHVRGAAMVPEQNPTFDRDVVASHLSRLLSGRSVPAQKLSGEITDRRIIMLELEANRPK